jgi:FtsP/CotA-like multicopper oxidase with cupredoxin domain
MNLTHRHGVWRLSAVRYDAPGAWMRHCQTPEHADGGMMGEVTSP